MSPLPKSFRSRTNQLTKESELSKYIDITIAVTYLPIYLTLVAFDLLTKSQP